jgi:hypothetical protein
MPACAQRACSRLGQQACLGCVHGVTCARERELTRRESEQDVQTNGPMAVLKYYSDPDAMQIFSKITSLLGLPADFAQASQGAAAPRTPASPAALMSAASRQGRPAPPCPASCNSARPTRLAEASRRRRLMPQAVRRPAPVSVHSTAACAACVPAC